jgi:hypothetical protein
MGSLAEKRDAEPLAAADYRAQQTHVTAPPRLGLDVARDLRDKP